MRTFFRDKLRFLLSVCLACSTVSAGAQVLARPGWAGSGINVETWWRTAVFYRVAPEAFQDSDGDGVGDLRGLSQRVDYLQSLGVDAVVLEMPFADAGMDDLLSEASHRHVRVLVSLASNDGDVVAKARHWLLVGAAGIWLKFPKGETADHVASLVKSVCAAASAVPGGRILVEDTTADAAIVPAPGAQLVARGLPPVSSQMNVGAIRSALTQAQKVPKGSDPLLTTTDGGAPDANDAHRDLKEKALALALMISRGAVALSYGQEVGVDSALSASAKPVMWWTPANVTKTPPPQEPAEAAKPAAAKPRRADEYGTYVPYVAPKVKRATKADPNELPGFTSGALPANAQAHAALADVVTQDSDKDSLLNFYRRLSQLHHSDPAVRTGTSYVLDLDEQNVLLWVMRAPAGARTGAALFAGCNLSDKRVDFSLKEDVKAMKLKGGPLRVIMTTAPANIQFDQISDAAMIAPESVMLAYLDH